MKKSSYFLVAAVLLLAVIFYFGKDVKGDEGFNSHIVINDVDVNDLTQLQLEEDFRALISVLENTGTDYLVDKRKYGEYLKNYEETVLEKNKGQWNIRTLYNAIYKTGVSDRSHTYFVRPKYFDKYTSLCTIGTGDTPSDEILKKSSEKNKILANILENGSASVYMKPGLANPSDSYNNGHITMKILEKDKTAYMKIPSFHIEEYKYSAAMTKFFRDIENYENFIIDIRGNSGGAVSPWMEIMSWFAKEDMKVEFYVGFRDTKIGETLKNAVVEGNQLRFFQGWEDIETQEIYMLPPNMNNTNKQDMEELEYFVKITDKLPKTVDYNFKGKIYLLVDEKTFSSSEIFAYYAKQTGFATIVGEQTGGDGTGAFGRFTYPLSNSGFVYEVQGTYGFNQDGSSNYERGTKPDIYANKKSALDLVLEMIE